MPRQKVAGQGRHVLDLERVELRVVDAAIRQGQRGIWLVAQSNVAVKNIAEKLLDSEFLPWRLLVSKDFIYEWSVYFFQLRTGCNTRLFAGTSISTTNYRIISFAPMSSLLHRCRGNFGSVMSYCARFLCCQMPAFWKKALLPLSR